MDAKVEANTSGNVGEKMGVNWDATKVDAIVDAKKDVNMDAKWDAKRDENVGAKVDEKNGCKSG